jgi:hypothetical protein
MTKPKLGRPTKMTEGVILNLIEAFKFGATVSEACFLSGISREMFYQHFRTDHYFSDRIEQARCWLSVKAKHNIANAIMNGDVKSSIWLLEKRDSLPVQTIQEEVPVTEEESWDEDDKQMLDAYLRTSIQLGIVHNESEYLPESMKKLL